MSATASHPAGSSSSDHLSFVYTANPDGWVAARIAEFPEAISQGERRNCTARANVLEALHDLTHRPTMAERVAFTIQAKVDELEQLIRPLGGKVADAMHAALERTHDRTLH